ncbi:aminomethyl-transferring glycine dehydrogenase subunit GcvPA [candidate division KSB1 bacterium]|nr:MAG: aminomethyl-transferring glycine dehydrogenase subunit GcvPA [candidate division KSB1 bacterium]
MSYWSNSELDLQAMLNEIGVKDFEELITNIPQDLRFKGEYRLPEGLSELEARQLLESLAQKNKTLVPFAGAGAYDHYVPAIVDEIASRPEFYTSYTPYQPEVSQGNLQVMYEFQSLICAITGMDVTNASMYEAGSALAEAILLSIGHTRNKKVLIPSTLNPRYKSIIKTYLNNIDAQLVEIPAKKFTLDMEFAARELDDSAACVVVQSPNYFGFLENVARFDALRQDKKALLIHAYDPISLGVLKPPAYYHADIAVAEGQALGNHLNYGGPYVGLFSVKADLVRKMPGRIAGETKDVDGRTGYVMTLQTREQHIRREKATSNICTNSGLLTTRAAIYLTALGKNGFQQVSRLCLQKAHYLAEELGKLPKVKLASAAPFFKEFTVELPKPATEVIKGFMEHGILAGVGLEKEGLPNHLLIAVTEKRSVKELDQYVKIMKSLVS